MTEQKDWKRETETEINEKSSPTHKQNIKLQLKTFVKKKKLKYTEV